MRGYDRDESGQSLEGYDDYEDDEEEGEEYEEEEEEEDPKTKKEALEYLGLRQRLKEQYRKQNKEGHSSLAKSGDKKKKLPYDNFGSFFGSSQPVIAPRVIQESKSFLENQHLASRLPNSLHTNKKSSGSTSAGSKPVKSAQKPRVINEVKTDVRKYTRDYSFLSSDDVVAPAPAPAPAKDPRNVSVQSSEVRASQMAMKSKVPLPNNGRPPNGGRVERKPVSTNGYMHAKVDPSKSSSASRRPDSKSVDSRKQLGSNNGNGPGRPLGPKGLPPKMPERKPSAPVVKNSMSGVHKPLPSKSQSSISKQNLPQRKDLREPNKPKLLPRQSAGMAKPQVKQPQMQRQISSRPISQEQRLKRKPVRSDPDDEYDDEAFRELRKVLGRRPSRYDDDDDDDDSDMEANFHDIMMEEQESERIGREEDEREARLLEEEERRKRMLKKRKLLAR